jgi:lysophospholipase L1-like esterase
MPLTGNANHCYNRLMRTDDTPSGSAGWSTAFAAALADPADTLPFMPQPAAFHGQTLTQRVRLRRGGSRLRLVLSNQFGTGPLVIDAVAAGRETGGSRQPVLLGGRAGWEIPPGATAVSDPVALPVTAGTELEVACYVAGSAGPAAFLHSAQRAGRAEPGNQTAATGAFGAGAPGASASGDQDGGGQAFVSLYWIAQVLTDAGADGPVVVAFGDSITRGDGTSLDGEQRYPDHLQARLLAAGLPGAAVLNAGLGGNRLLRPRVGPPMTGRFARDVLGVAGATHVIIMGGINDLGLPGLLGEQGPAAGEIIDGLFSLARRAAEQGIQPVLGTMTPIVGRYAFLSAAGNEDIRQAVNRAVLAQPEWPAADFAAAVANPADPARIAAAFDSGDGVHPNDDGARALAGALDLSVFGPVSSAGASPPDLASPRSPRSPRSVPGKSVSITYSTTL